ncbi:ABC transporter permease [Thermococcus sp. MV5]|uniref:ABC transporter permease n=1 Tax=Thermococcus sp. MV5 TaxID=1638272 RepID=UPI00143BFF4C|nr:ABC transporter permease [Thermococcus sp. MV5]NJE26142.1 ABC transporter permease [Thermococcus sp. MV5]
MSAVENVKLTYDTYIRPMLKNKKALAGLLILTFFLVLAIIGPTIWPLNMESDFSNRFLPPSWEHPFGTDYFGVDVFRQLVAGTRVVLVVTFLPAMIGTILATSIGIAAGYIGGMPGRLLNGIIDIFMTIPSFPALLLMAAFFREANIILLSFIIAMWLWAQPAKTIAAQVLSLRSMEFVEAAELLELGRFHIIFKELMPHLVPYIFIQFVNMVRASFGASQGLMFLGLLRFNPTHWGVMLNIAIYQSGALYVPYAAFYPVAILTFMILLLSGFVLISYGVEETFNPRLRTYE